VWTCTQISFTSYTFTSLPLVHTLNPDFLGWRLWLCFLLVRESPIQEISAHRVFRTWPPTDFRISWFCRFMALDLHKFATSELHLFEIPYRCTLATLEASQVQDSRCSHIRDFGASQVQDSRFSRILDFDASQVQDSRSSHIRDFRASQVQDSRSSWVLYSWKLITRISYISTFWGWHVFLNSPTLAPRVVGWLRRSDSTTILEFP
jgi:hypothetical protein